MLLDRAAPISFLSALGGGCLRVRRTALLENGLFVNGITEKLSMIDQACNKRQTPLSPARTQEW
jgi:hypothetical protein